MSSHKKILIITLLMIIFSFNIGYSKFVDSSIISNTTQNIGTAFNLVFNKAYIEKANGININNSIVKISQDKKGLYLGIADFSYPGAGAVINAEVINQGTIPAKIDSIYISGINDNSWINIQLIDGKNKILNPGEKGCIGILVKWDSNYNIGNNEVQNFKIDLNYIQAY